jgi:aryl sulfotransferase
MQISPWIEAIFMGPAEGMHAMLADQQHRRVMKSHSPADGIPWFDDARYIFVCRDGRDAFMSLINHVERMKFVDEMNAQALRDGVPPMPDYDGDPHAFFAEWLQDELLFFDIVASYWAERKRDNLLFVHFNDLKRDLEGEMRRIADFLAIAVPEDAWPAVVERCTFEHMRANEEMVGDLSMGFEGGTKGFLHKGTNGRWRDVLTETELAQYERRLRETLPEDAIAWVNEGRAT